MPLKREPLFFGNWMTSHRVEQGQIIDLVWSGLIIFYSTYIVHNRRNRITSNPIEVQTGRSTLNHIEWYYQWLIWAGKNGLNMKLRQAEVMVEREWHLGWRECDLAQGCNWKGESGTWTYSLMNKTMALDWDAGVHRGRGKGGGEGA
jgi:hypothetical protein